MSNTRFIPVVGDEIVGVCRCDPRKNITFTVVRLYSDGVYIATSSEGHRWGLDKPSSSDPYGFKALKDITIKGEYYTKDFNWTVIKAESKFKNRNLYIGDIVKVKDKTSKQTIKHFIVAATGNGGYVLANVEAGTGLLHVKYGEERTLLQKLLDHPQYEVLEIGKFNKFFKEVV